MHEKRIVTAGQPLTSTSSVLILLHGRGASAEDILGLAGELNVKGYTLIAPQAANYTWYPYSFMAPITQNEPFLSSAIQVVEEIANDVKRAGVPDDQVFFAGFSQGACLTLEFIARHAKRWGGAAAFTGGLIGDKLYTENYRGNFAGMPVFIGTSDPDPHVPVTRVRDSTSTLRGMGAEVTETIYPGLGHTISRDEIVTANKIVFK